MSDTAPQFIGKRIKVQRSKESIVVEITQQVERWQEAVLLAWILAWTFCGIVFIYFAFASSEFSTRMICSCMTAFWMYFFVRIARVFFWRKKGKEIITLKASKLYLQNAYGKKGRVEEFHFHNIFKLGLIKRSTTSFMGFLDDSFWIIGGDRVGFSYSGSEVRMGKQLSINDAELLIRVITAGLKEYK
jgi:hypothetical protein